MQLGFLLPPVVLQRCPAMVSTRSQSVLSAGAATDTAATAGEVNSAAPTPRRSGRLARGSGGAAAAATPTAPRSARAAKTRKQLEAVKEVEERQEAEQAEHPPSQQEEQQPHASGDAQAQAEEQQGEQLSPRVRRRLQSAAEAALAGSPLVSQPDDAEDVSEGAAGAPSNGAEVEPVLKADAALVDVLAAQMFAALEEFTGQQQHDDSSTDSELDMIEEQQQRSGSAAETGRQRQQHQLQQEGQQQDADSSSSNDDSSDSEDEGEAGDSVPSHLRWQPELMLPGQAASGSGSGAAARSAAAPAGVHVVRRGKDGLHVPPPDERLRARAARTERPDTAGKGWFDLPATQITDEVKNDLRMLRLRCVAHGGVCGCEGVLNSTDFHFAECFPACHMRRPQLMDS